MGLGTEFPRCSQKNHGQQTEAQCTAVVIMKLQSSQICEYGKQYHERIPQANIVTPQIDNSSENQ